MKGFRIISLSLTKHPILGTNEFKFYDGDDKDTGSPYFTILIGPNGTGKSEILRCLLLIFKDLYQHLAGFDFKHLHFFYELNYILDGVVYKYTNTSDGKLIFLTETTNRYSKGKLYRVDEELIEYNSDDYFKIFPLQIVAQSIMMTDKFFVPRNSDDMLRFAPYHYLGIRNRPQQSSTGYYVRRTVELIIKAVKEKYFKKGIEKLVKYIDSTGSFIIQYKTSNTKKFWNGELTAEHLIEYFKEIESKYRNKQAPYKLGHFNSLKKNSVTLVNIVEFINRLYNKNLLKHISKSSAKYLNFDLRVDYEMDFLEKNQYSIDWLRKIGLLSLPTIKFSDKDVELQKASSGEFHLFTTMIGLMASTRANSLIIIDEPEISLHPNWQMKYIQFIRELFDETDRITSHIIIATHSHFLISDLQVENSNIIGLKKKDGQIESMEINKDTYGWSAEDVLYNIFNVRTSLNYYLEADLTELLGLIAMNSNEKLRMQEILDKLVKLPQRKNDPLQEIIIEAKDYIDKI
jgi:predicted ATP-dependent endonuclease of OLD family